MIYAGIIYWNDTSNLTPDLCHALESYTQAPPTVIRKDSLTLVYGKLSSTQDVDEIWENENVLIIGRVFNKAKKCSFGKKDFKNLSSVSPEDFLKKVWGKYVYIQKIKEGCQFNVVVDLTGQLPFFYYTYPNGNVLFSSEIEILFKVLGQKPKYNWTYLCSYIVYGNSSTIHTPFQDIYELPPACCLKIEKTTKETRPFWNPLDSYQKQEIQERGAKNILQDTLKPWIEHYKNICVSLSGGLDSSSLVYCLQEIVRNDQTLSALNYFHSSVKSSNELVHARKVCKENDIDLIELEVSDHLPFSPPLKKKIFNPNKPFPGLVSLNLIEIVSDHLPKDSCTFLSGHGSDHIFMRPPSKRSISDYILEKGVRGSKVQFDNTTQFYRDSFFPILKENIKSLGSYSLSRRLHKRNSKNIQDELPEWITQRLYQKVSHEFTHPIYSTLSEKVLPGKYDQIDAFYEGLASIHMEMDRINSTAYPFLYEPVVEFALSFPTYELFSKGYDRYPLRKSISEHFKTETVWRRDKSQTTGIFQLGVKKNLQNILELCLEGHFVKQGLIDREGLYRTIILIANGDINHLSSFMRLVSTEIFLKMWDEKVF